MEDATTTSTLAPEPLGRWCLVANVVDEREWGQGHEIRPGAKHFPAGAKVYCDFPLGFWQWDGQFGKVRVLGHHRGSKRLVCMIVKAQWLYNFRVKCEYSPEIRRLLDEKHEFRLGGYTEEARQEADQQAKTANEIADQAKAECDSRTVPA
jgi:hypothetical protein